MRKLSALCQFMFKHVIYYFRVLSLFSLKILSLLIIKDFCEEPFDNDIPSVQGLVNLTRPSCVYSKPFFLKVARLYFTLPVLMDSEPV